MPVVVVLLLAVMAASSLATALCEWALGSLWP